MSTETATRPFVLEDGDMLTCNKDIGSLFLMKVSGERIDLNALRIDATEGSGETLMRLFSPPVFMQFCSVLAASYGLAASRAHFHRDVFECMVTAPEK